MPGRRPTLDSVNLRRLALAAIVLVAAALRLANLGFGLPERWHLDEIGTADRIAAGLRGHVTFGYSYGPLATLLLLGPLAVTRRLAPAHLDADLAGAAIMAYRLLSAVAGTAETAVTYLYARRFVRPRLAVVAAGLVAVVPLHVVSSKYGAPDVLLSLFMTLALLLALHLVEEPCPEGAPRPGHAGRLAFGAGACAALAIATKYNGALVLPAVVAALTLGPARRSRRTLLLAAAGLGAGLGLGFAPLFGPGQLGRLLGAGEYEYGRLFAEGHFGIKVGGLDELYSFHLRRSLFPALGAPWLAAALGSAALSLRRVARRGHLWRRHAVVLAFALPYEAVIETAYKAFPFRIAMRCRSSPRRPSWRAWAAPRSSTASTPGARAPSRGLPWSRCWWPSPCGGRRGCSSPWAWTPARACPPGWSSTFRGARP